jgi:M6 family metalloprotease-like protein
MTRISASLLLAFTLTLAAPSCKRSTEPHPGVPAGKTAVNFALGLEDADRTTRLMGHLRAVVVLIEFPDQPADKTKYPPERLEAFMFDPKAKGLGQFVAENSGGKYTISGKVFGWYTSKHTAAEINDTPGGLDDALGRLAEEAVRRVLDEGINPAEFDNDGPDGVPRSDGSTDDDGLVDELYVIPSGGVNCGIGMMGRYADFAKRTTFLYLENGDGGFGNTGFYMHELGHHFYFAWDHYGNHWQGEYGSGIWAIMALGCWGQRGDIPADEVWTQPSHFSPFSKITMGWAVPRVITETTRDVKLMAMELRPDCVEIPIPGTLEYFLVENRQPIGFEDKLPGGGLLIWRCNRTYKGDFRLVQADGRDDLQHGHAVGRPYPPTSEDLGDAGDPFPGSTGNGHFGPKTNPSSLTEKGLDSGVTIRAISPPGETMSFDVIIDADVQQGLARLTTIRGSLDELTAPNAVRRRNAALSLVEIADARAIPALIAALDDADRKVRLYAVQALDRLKVPQAVPALSELAAHGDPELAAVAVEALGHLAPDLTGGERLEALARVTAALESGSKQVRAAGLHALAGLADPAFEDVFIAALGNDQPDVQRLGAEGVGAIKSNKAVAPLIVIARDEAADETVRVAALDALGRIGYEPAAVAIHSLLGSTSFSVRAAAARALQSIHSKDSVPALISALRDDRINDGAARHGDLRRTLADALTAIARDEARDAVPELEKLVGDAAAPVESRSLAATALGNLGNPSAVDALVRAALAIDAAPEPWSLSEVFDLVEPNQPQHLRSTLAAQARRLVLSSPPNGQQAARASLDLLIAAGTSRLRNEDPKRRVEAIELLRQCAVMPAPDELLAALEDTNPDVRVAAAAAFAELKDGRALPVLIERLDDDYWTVRQAAARALGELGDGRAVPALVERLGKEQDRRVVIQITAALGRIGTPETVAPLRAALVGPVYEARVEAARALGRHNDAAVVDALIAVLPDADYGVLINPRWANVSQPRLRVWAMRSLAEIGDHRAVEPIRAYLESDDYASRLEAVLALARLDGRNLQDLPWAERVRAAGEYIEEATGRELLDFVPREYLRP